MELYTYEKDHIARLRQYAPECMVLLRSNGDFPLDAPGKIALYGSGARRTIKGGTGSGDVNSRFYVTVEQGLENAGFEVVTRSWMDAYDVVQQKAHEAFIAGIKEAAKAAGVPALFLGMGAVMPEPEYELPLSGEADTAVYVLSRISGEGSDRKAVKGDLLLTDTEIHDILALQKQYRKFLLVLNVGGMVDLSPVMETENILLLSQLGVVTGDALADVILGKAYPSGKLAATWTGWRDHPTVGDFGGEDDTHYVEGIYVGYRYFDSIGQNVLFPFGYGLGYTTFSMENVAVKLDGTKVLLSVRISNNGSRPGKEVAQAYVSIPAGKLDQPFQVLAAFTKTEEVAPGGTNTVELAFDMAQLASFDTERACDVLEAGSYIIRVGSNSRTTDICAIVELDEEVIVRCLSNAGGDPGFSDWKPKQPKRPVPPVDKPVLHLDRSAFQTERPQAPAASPDAVAKVKGLSDSDLAYLCCGNFRTGEESKSVIGAAGVRVPGSAGETADRLDEIPSLVMADGPAGLRLNKQYGVDEDGVYQIGNAIPAAFWDFMDDTVLKMFGIDDVNAPTDVQRHGTVHEQYCSAIPIGTALAQSWNLAVCEGCGDLVGDEMERFGVHLWLAPAFNIQRDPLCGRNFEYCSEDPYISGKTAAAITRGVQAHSGCGVTVKHYCCNNQETNRFRSNSAVSQRALRDIYLKGFEICIKESAPAALMTSYNLLNGIHTSEREDILEGILRKEWGYEGLVMSDWITKLSPDNKKYPYAAAAMSVKAGNDIVMPGGQADHDDILAALQSGTLTRSEIERSAARVVALVMKLTEAHT